MQVHELMSSSPATISPQDSLDRAATLMWNHDCGMLPVVDGNGRVGATITDRDVCMAAWSRGLPLAELRVRDAMSRSIVWSKRDWDVAKAATVMRENRVRRLPVVDDAGKLVGVLSLNDLARAGARDAAIGAEALRVLTSVCTRGQVAASAPAKTAVATTTALAAPLPQSAAAERR